MSVKRTVEIEVKIPVDDPEVRRTYGWGVNACYTLTLLDGDKAAVSIQVTKLGAKILWESFQTPTPDISFSFEMDMSGYRSPHRALIEGAGDSAFWQAARRHGTFGRCAPDDLPTLEPARPR